MAAWYYGENGAQRGPVEDDEIRQLLASGRMNASTIVWREGMDNWKPIGEVPEWAEQVVATPATAVSPYQPPQSFQPGYYGPSPMPPNNGNAIASLVCGISSLVMLFTCFLGILAGIPAVICGHIALKQMRESATPMGGRGMAITGLVTGYLTVGLTLAFGVFFGVALAFGSTP